MTMWGVLTIATGKAQYIEQAKSLARSCRLHNPALSIAIVTDSRDPTLGRFFNHVISRRPELGGPFRQKLSVEQYTPYERTLYIDSDCLVTGPLDHLRKLVDDRDFAIHGQPISSGFWYTDIAALIARLGVAGVPKFNSGLFCLRKGQPVDDLLARARDILDHHESFDLIRTHDNQCGDEPALSIAMAEAKIAAVPDDGTGQGGTIDWVDPRLEIDVPRGYCRYISPDHEIRPPVAHFLAHGWRRPEYRREVLKIRLAHDYHFPVWLTTVIGQVFDAAESARAVARHVKNKLIRKPASA